MRLAKVYLTRQTDSIWSGRWNLGDLEWLRASGFQEGGESLESGETLAFPGSISEGSAKQLPASADELLRNIFALLENLVLSVIEKRTAAEFSRARDEALPKYLDAVIALSSLTQLLVKSEVVERLNREFFCELEADLRDRGLIAFGVAVRDQALFTVWTLRKISDLTSQIASVRQVGETQKPAVEQLLIPCIYHAIRTRFHVQCLVTSMQTGRPIYPDVLELVIDGLRSVVNAYALVRRLLDIFVPLTAPEIAPVEWDDEDRELLAEATRDMAEPA
jgi:hypothetical protein